MREGVCALLHKEQRRENPFHAIWDRLGVHGVSLYSGVLFGFESVNVALKVIWKNYFGDRERNGSKRADVSLIMYL